MGLGYSEKLIDHFKNPRNQGHIDNADGIGQVGNPVCGDVMKIYLKIEPKDKNLKSEEDAIEDVKFETLGCGAAIACSSVLTEMIKGKKIKEAVNISKKNIAEELGGVPSPKMHCSVLATDGLKKAIENYFKK